MENSGKRILIVCDDESLRSTRALVLESAGYHVKTVSSDDKAMKLLETETFDLVLIGRDLTDVEKQIDQRLRERYADLRTLKIQIAGEVFSIWPSRTVDSLPIHVLAALAEMLGG
jgi:CheY-like chemotaxis protein